MRDSFPLEDVINEGQVTEELKRKSLGEYIIHAVKKALWMLKETLATTYQSKGSSDPYIKLYLKSANQRLGGFTEGFRDRYLNS